MFVLSALSVSTKRNNVSTVPFGVELVKSPLFTELCNICVSTEIDNGNWAVFQLINVQVDSVAVEKVGRPMR